MERQGAGKRIRLKDAATPKLPALVRQMLADNSFRDNARRIQAVYAQLDRRPTRSCATGVCWARSQELQLSAIGCEHAGCAV